MAGAWGRRPSALGWVLHAGLQPALRDGKKPCGFARGEGFVKAEHAAVAAVALGSVDGKRGAEEAAAVGRMCRGRNDERAHGNGCL